MMTTQLQIDEQALEWFARLSDIDAPASAWMAFQDWLEADDAHRLAYDRIEQTWVAIETVPPAAVAILPVAANDQSPPLRVSNAGRRRPGWLLSSFAAAAAAAVVVGVGVWPQISGAPVETYHTDMEPRTVVLSDGSQVVMNRHSDLSVRMGRSARTVTLAEGEAAFDVTHNPARPFVITAGSQSVRVLGTAFNVLNHNGQFEVAVERGVVAVTPAAAQGSARPAVRLLAGQKIVQNQSEAPTLSQVSPERASLWRQGVLLYRDASLAEVADYLSRYFDMPVTVDPSARPLHFTGALQVGDEATMLKQLQDFVPVQVIRSSAEIRLSGRGAR